MVDIQQGLTSLISSLESVIIRVNLMLWPQDKMSENAARNFMAFSAPLFSSSRGGLFSLPYAADACPVGLPHQLRLWAAHQH